MLAQSSEFSFEMCSDKTPHLQMGLQLAMNEDKASCFMDITHPKHPRTFALLWHDIPGSHKLPVRMDHKTTHTLVEAWLRDLTPADYGSSPNIDGSCKKGFRITKTVYRSDLDYNDQIGTPYAIVYIQPCWIEYHK